ncbi:MULTISPECIES: fimbrial biogenesis chaperone [unclassified Luteibacter]|uniref:fimbrial biogenesis chaperone n=1 Tax=Luteibacter sp. PvP019 TaxID=3156436 RepID=UPI0033921DD8
MEATKRNVAGLARALLALLLVAAVPASAGVVMNATRYIYNAGDREISVRLTNKGSLPVLTQAWIDDGDARSTPEHVDVPFNLTPPIARVESGRSQTLRIAFTDGTLPEGRESQFWLNVLEVPPKAADGSEGNTMQLAFRYRLKLFYRPKGLKGSPARAAEALTWTRSPEGTLAVSNASPFYVALNELRLTTPSGEVEAEPLSIAPHASVTPPLPKALPPGRLDIHYQSINDYGGFVAHSTTIDAR